MHVYMHNCMSVYYAFKPHSFPSMLLFASNLYDKEMREKNVVIKKKQEARAYVYNNSIWEILKALWLKLTLNLYEGMSKLPFLWKPCARFSA